MWAPTAATAISSAPACGAGVGATGSTQPVAPGEAPKVCCSTLPSPARRASCPRGPTRVTLPGRPSLRGATRNNFV